MIHVVPNLSHNKIIVQMHSAVAMWIMALAVWYSAMQCAIYNPHLCVSFEAGYPGRVFPHSHTLDRHVMTLPGAPD